MNFTYKAYENGRVVQSMRTHSIRRFLNRTRTIKWQKEHFNVYLRVSYKKGFYNDGDYQYKKDFWLAFYVFTE